MEALYQEYRDRYHFYMIYVREAHPTDGWQMPSNVAEGVEIRQHRSAGERVGAAEACAAGLRLSMPILLDTMENRADRIYHGWPERLYVLAADGAILYQGGRGPYGFSPGELAAFLAGRSHDGCAAADQETR